MIFHASSMAVLFADCVAQAPVVVQCAEAVPESWVKWLLPTIIQTIVSLVSITAGVWIAVASFRANKGKEHTQWILDHKRAEWRDLLSGLNAIYFPMALAKQMKKALPLEGSQRLLELSQCFQDRVFIDATILTKFQVRLEKYALEYVGQSEDKPSSDEEKEKVLDKLKSLTVEVRETAKRDLTVRCEPTPSATKADEP